MGGFILVGPQFRHLFRSKSCPCGEFEMSVDQETENLLLRKSPQFVQGGIFPILHFLGIELPETSHVSRDLIYSRKRI